MYGDVETEGRGVYSNDFREREATAEMKGCARFQFHGDACGQISNFMYMVQ